MSPLPDSASLLLPLSSPAPLACVSFIYTVCLFARMCVSVLFIIYISVYVYLYKIAFCSPA